MGRPAKDYTGQEFGYLIAIKQAPSKRGNAQWLCSCICGNETVVDVQNMRKGNTKSCGCKKHEMDNPRKTTHGLSKTRLYKTWSSMKTRCNNPNAGNYEYYGGRGISICDEWNDEFGFVSFYEWAITHGYEDELTLDRIDGNGNYEPANCRWATWATQMANQRRYK